MLCLPEVEMPKNCHECDAFGLSDVVGLKCPCNEDSNKYSYADRPKDCPLIWTDAIEELLADLERAKDYAEAWEGLANDCKSKFEAFVEKMKR